MATPRIETSAPRQTSLCRPGLLVSSPYSLQLFLMLLLDDPGADAWPSLPPGSAGVVPVPASPVPVSSAVVAPFPFSPILVWSSPALKTRVKLHFSTPYCRSRARKRPTRQRRTTPASGNVPRKRGPSVIEAPRLIFIAWFWHSLVAGTSEHLVPNADAACRRVPLCGPSNDHVTRRSARLQA
jgi:hypothetical protein